MIAILNFCINETYYDYRAENVFNHENIILITRSSMLSGQRLLGYSKFIFTNLILNKTETEYDITICLLQNEKQVPKTVVMLEELLMSTYGSTNNIETVFCV